MRFHPDTASWTRSVVTMLAGGTAILACSLGAVDTVESVVSGHPAPAPQDPGTPSWKSPSTPTNPAQCGPATDVVYVESNIPVSGQNSILAFHRSSDGSLTALPGSPFLTGGTGVGNPDQILGPDDADQQIIATDDHRRLYAVNSGSNTIAVFDIAQDGSLTAIDGSPFPSGGANPVSLGIANDHLYVVNKAQNPAQEFKNAAPSYAVFSITPGGGLKAIPKATVAAGASPSQALISPDQMHLFGADFMAPMPLRSFVVQGSGRLVEASGSPMALPEASSSNGAALGLATNPRGNILYAGFVQRSQIGVYTYDDSGVLTFNRAITSSGVATCWLRVNAAGTRLYAVNTGDGSISVFNTADPLLPREEQKVTLMDLGPSFVDSMGMTQPISSAPFQEAIDPNGTTLYVVSQRVTTDPAFTSGNTLHVLAIDTDGQLSERFDLALPVPPSARAEGVVAF